MVSLFQEFTLIWAILGGILAAGIIFEKPLIKLEDFIDEKIAEKRGKRK